MVILIILSKFALNILSTNYETVKFDLSIGGTSTLNMLSVNNQYLQNNLSIGNTSQNIILNAKTLNCVYANNIYTLYKNIQYNFPVYYNSAFNGVTNILIPIKYVKSSNIYNTFFK